MRETNNIAPCSEYELKDETYAALSKDYGKEVNNTPQNPLRIVELAEFLAMELPARELILSPWLPKAGLCMIHARPGVGKTHLSLNIAYAVASGGQFLGWRAEKPSGVLFIDGEMPAAALQERLAQIAMTNGKSSLGAKLQFITPDFQVMGMPDLATWQGQECINQHITDEIDLIIVDNLSCLLRTGRENESESWLPVQTWALSLRAKGKSVLFIHHSGKGGSQRGSSKKEDVLDTVISLKRPEDYTQDKGACFVVSFEKARGFHGEDAKPFEASLIVGDKNQSGWTTRSLEESTYEKVIGMLNDGMSQTEIANELGIHKSTVNRHAKRAKQEGVLTNNKERA
jgi:hypothetical protein